MTLQAVPFESCDFDAHFARRAAQSLQESLGLPVEIWRPAPPWTRWTETADASEPFHSEADPERTALEQARLAPLRPHFVGSSGATVAAIPVLSQGRLAFIATCRHESSDGAIFRRAVAQAQQTLVHSEELARLRQRNLEYAIQVTQDFEELVFLRAVASQLEGISLSLRPSQAAHQVLDLLFASVHAETLLWLDAELLVPESWHESHVCRLGAASPAISTCVRLVQEFRHAALDGPVVRNNFLPCDPGAAFPGVRSFVLSALRSSERVSGYLLAVNRVVATEDLPDAPWHLGPHEFGTNEAMLLESASAMLAAHARNFEMLREREQLLVKVVRTLVSSIEAKDEYTRGHSERVALFARRLAREIGFDEAAGQRLYLTGLLHDVGKIGVSDATLKKPEGLSEQEYREVQRHPDCGWMILHDLEPLGYVLPGVLHHHERFDGRGYPDGLAGEQIPLEGRILAIADAYDAMTSDRPYRQGMPHERAEAVLRDGAGSQWDPQLVEVFLRISPDIVALRSKYCPSPAPHRKAAACS